MIYAAGREESGKLCGKVRVKGDAHFSCYKRALTYLETTIVEITAQLQNGTPFPIFFVPTTDPTTCVALCVQAQARLRLFGI